MELSRINIINYKNKHNENYLILYLPSKYRAKVELKNIKPILTPYLPYIYPVKYKILLKLTLYLPVKLRVSIQ